MSTESSGIPELVSLLLGQDNQPLRWFRGQGCDSRNLRPSLVRKALGRSAAELMSLERRLITRFRQRSLPLWPEGYRQLDWEHLFAMQHHGVPTRLLDWSESALIGAYFAADHDPARCECGTGVCRPTLWALDPVKLNRMNSRLEGYGEALGVLATSDEAVDAWAPGTEEVRFAPWPIALYGTHNSARIAAQQGTFTVSGKELIPLEEVPAVHQDNGVLTKIAMECDHADILKQLRTLGVTRASVYPDLAGLATDISNEELHA